MSSSFIVIQSDWNESLWETKGQAWILVKQPGSKGSIYGKIKTDSFDRLNYRISLKCEDGFEVMSVSRQTIQVQYPSLNLQCKFVAPSNTFKEIHRKAIMDMDISCGGGLGVSTDTDGNMFVWDTHTGIIRRNLLGHMGDVNCCRFFPSGVVVLSGGSDTQLKVWSAEDGSCARTLKSTHQGGVLSVETIERGRNVISTSRDGCVCLWECGSSRCIGKLAAQRSEVNACHVSEQPADDERFAKLVREAPEDENIDRPSPADADLESGTEGKILAIGCENGNAEVLHLPTRKSLFARQLGSAVNCCIFVSSNLLLAGTQDGQLCLLDVSMAGETVVCDTSSSSAVLSLRQSQLLAPQPAFWASHRDGRCALYRIVLTPHPRGLGDSPTTNGSSDVGEQSEFRLVLELTGSDCDPVYRVVESCEGIVFTCARDACVRRYDLKNLL